MAISRIQKQVTNTVSTTTHQITLGSTPTPGNLIIVAYRNSQVVANTTISAGWSIGVAQDDDDAGAFSIGILFRVVQAGDTATYTVMTTSLNAGVGMETVEMAGLLAAGTILDKGPAANDPTGTGTSCATASTGTLSRRDEYAFAICGLGSTYSAPSVDSGFTVLDSGSIVNAIVAEKIVANDTTALVPTFSWTTARGRDAAIATFFPAASLPAPPPKPRRVLMRSN